MYSIFRTKNFKKDYKKLSKTDKETLKTLIIKLSKGEILEEKYKDHKLIGNYNDCRECHVKPDLLLIYKTHNDVSELSLTRVGSHSELFKK
jgi:mRNA interferase YafQ